MANLLDDYHRLLLRAAFGKGNSKATAYAKWRANVRIDEIDFLTYRILPLLLQTSKQCNPPDEDTPTMRGVGKHIWLTNMLRLKSLLHALTALKRAEIDALILKGAALFARSERLQALHLANDYDIQVRPTDASRAIDVLTRCNFRIVGQLTEHDFELIHAARLVKGKKEGDVDLHWRPLPIVRDQAYVNQLFAHSEPATLNGRVVRVPGLADHLFLTVARPEPWDRKEIFFRAVETIHLLSGCDGRLDWDRFEYLVSRYALGWIAASMLDLVRAEACPPMPDGTVERIWGRAGPIRRLELAMRSTPPYGRSAISRFIVKSLDIARSRLAPTSTAPLSSAHFYSQLRAHFGQVAKEELLPLGSSIQLRSLWRAQVIRRSKFNRAWPVFVQGFSSPEETGRWTDGKLAILEMPVDAAVGEPVQLRLIGHPFLGPQARRFACKIIAGSRPANRYLFETGGRFDAILEGEAVGNPNRKIVVVFALTDASAPRVHGLSDDHRMLGLFIERVEILTARAGKSISAPRSGSWSAGDCAPGGRDASICVLRRPSFRDYRIGVGKISAHATNPEGLWFLRAARDSRFSCPGPVFVQGFSSPEETGRWTDGKLAILEMPVDAAVGEPVQLRLIGHPFLGPQARRFACKIIAGSRPANRYLFETGGRFDAILEGEAVGNPNRKIVVVFALTDASAPRVHGLSDDHRMLGLFIERVEIMRVDRSA